MNPQGKRPPAVTGGLEFRSGASTPVTRNRRHEYTEISVVGQFEFLSETIFFVAALAVANAFFARRPTASRSALRASI